jgi:hypothetical protein
LFPGIELAVAVAATLAGSRAAGAQAGQAQPHGEVSLAISIEARCVGLRVEARQDSLFGRQRTPRTAAAPTSGRWRRLRPTLKLANAPGSAGSPVEDPAD